MHSIPWVVGKSSGMRSSLPHVNGWIPGFCALKTTNRGVPACDSEQGKAKTLKNWMPSVSCNRKERLGFK